MRYELLAIRFGLVSSLALWLAAPGALAQDAPPAAQAAECFPKCRSGYLCHEGVCITGCNPPCADKETCTPEGECMPKVTKPPRQPRAPNGITLGFTLGATLCATPDEHGCRTAGGDAGAYVSIRGGYQFFPWLIVDADASIIPLFLKNDPNAKVGLLFAGGLGARFVPLGRRHAVDPVLGLHAGYFLSFVKNRDNASTEKTSAHGFYLAYEAGVEFNLGPASSLGLKLDIFEPFWITTCDTVDGVAACSRIDDADNNQLYFGAGLSGDFLL